MSKVISNRPETEHRSTLEELLIAKLGKREYGKLRDELLAKTRKPRRRRG